MYEVILRFRGKGISDSNNVDKNFHGHYDSGGRIQDCHIGAASPDGLDGLIYSSDQRPFETLPTQVFFIRCFGGKVKKSSSIVINLSEIFSKLQATEEGFQSYGIGTSFDGVGVELLSEVKSPDSIPGSFYSYTSGEYYYYTETLSNPWSWHK